MRGERRRAVTKAFVGGALGATILALGACDPKRGELPFAEVTGRELEAVEPPPDLAQLDAAVQNQFRELWQGRQEAPPAEAAEVWGRLGQWFDVYHYDDSAGRCYRNAHALDPEEARWVYFRGLLAERSGDLGSAGDLLQEAVLLAPREPAPRVRLADLALKLQQSARAEELYGGVLAEEPENPGALFGLAQVALSRGEPEAALPLLRRLAAVQPEAVQVRYALAQAWRDLGDGERAARHLAEVPEDNLDQIALDLGSPWDRELQLLDRGARTLTRRGVRAYRRGERGQAAVLLGAAVAAEPEGPEKRINYGVALRGTGHWAEAEEQLKEALRLADAGSEEAAKAHLELGRLLAAGGRRGEAEGHFDASLAIDPKSPVLHVEFGRFLHQGGRLEEALHHYGTARDLDRRLAEVRLWHAALLLALDRPEAALRSLEDDLALLGGERSLHLLLARLLSGTPAANQRDVGRARRELLASTSRAGGESESPAEGETGETLDVFYAETAAMVAAEEGSFAEAVAWQEAAVRALDGFRPRSALHRARRRLVLYQRGEPCRSPWETGEAVLRRPVEAPAA